MIRNLTCFKCHQDSAVLTYEENRVYKVACPCGCMYSFEHSSMACAEGYHLQEVQLHGEIDANTALRTRLAETEQRLGLAVELIKDKCYLESYGSCDQTGRLCDGCAAYLHGTQEDSTAAQTRPLPAWAAHFERRFISGEADMQYSKETYVKALYGLSALRDSVSKSECFTVEFIMEAVAEKCDRNYPCTHSDCIRGMSDDDLAGFLAEVENRRSASGGGAEWNGKAHAFQWLRQPLESAKENRP